MKGWVDLFTAVSVQPVPKAACRSDFRENTNFCPQRDSNLGPLAQQASVLPLDQCYVAVCRGSLCRWQRRLRIGRVVCRRARQSSKCYWAVSCQLRSTDLQVLQLDSMVGVQWPMWRLPHSTTIHGRSVYGRRLLCDWHAFPVSCNSIPSFVLLSRAAHSTITDGMLGTVSNCICGLVSLTDIRSFVVSWTNTRFGDRCFSNSGPKTWNSLPSALSPA